MIFGKSLLPIIDILLVLAVSITDILENADISVFYRYVGGNNTKI